MNLEEKLYQNAMTGASIVDRYLRGEIDGSEKVKVGALSVGQYQRFMGTKHAGAGLAFAVMRWVSTDKKELKKLVKQHGLIAEK
jgi:hypothetical protein